MSASKKTRSLADLRDVWPQFWELLKPERRTIAAYLAISLPQGFLTAAAVALVAETAVAFAAGERMVTAGAASLQFTVPVPRAIVIALVLALVLLAMASVTPYLSARIVANSQARLRNDLFQKFVHTRWAVQSRERNGHLQEVMTTQVNRSARLTLKMIAGWNAALTLLGLIVSAFLIAPTAAGAMLLAGLLLFALFRPLARRVNVYSRLHAHASVEYAAAVNENVQLSEEYHVFDAAEAQEADVAGKVEDVRHPFLLSEMTTELVGGMYGTIVIVMLVLGLGGLYLTGVTDLGSVGAVVLILLRSLTSATGVQTAYTHIHNHLPYFERVLEARERYEKAAVPPAREPLSRIDHFSFENVHYSYGDDEEALRGVTFEVTAGTAVGIVGPSGSGKSTIVQLLLRLRTPDRGYYLVNGQDASIFDRRDWARLVTYVPQEPKLLHGTIADNIRFHREGVSRDQIEHAARLAHMHEEIVAFPDGYDRFVGQGASQVSGGQRQRLCLARALLTGPEVVILDEPTSSLDPRSEQAVQRSLEELRARGVTFFIIAHRPATLRFIDQLLVLSEGELVSSGTPHEVAARDAFAKEALSGAVFSDGGASS